MQLNFNPLTNGIQSNQFNLLKDLPKFAEKVTGEQEVKDRYNKVPWAGNQPMDKTVPPMSRDGLQSFPMQANPPEPSIDVDGMLKGIDLQAQQKQNTDSLAGTNDLAADPTTMTKANVSGFGEVSTATGANPMLMALGGGFGVLNGILENKQKNEELRRREIEVEQAIGQNASEREKIEMMNPNANLRVKMGMLQDGKSQAMQQAANVGGAAVANSGLGGDVGSAKIAAMKASAPMAQAGAGFDQQMAGAVDQKTGEENQQIGQLSNNTMQRANLSQMTDYIDQQKNTNPISGILSSALTGMTGFNIMDTMVGKTKTDKLTPGKQANV
jgi:hypothetical protein